MKIFRWRGTINVHLGRGSLKPLVIVLYRWGFDIHWIRRTSWEWSTSRATRRLWADTGKVNTWIGRA